MIFDRPQLRQIRADDRCRGCAFYLRDSDEGRKHYASHSDPARWGGYALVDGSDEWECVECHTKVSRLSALDAQHPNDLFEPAHVSGCSKQHPRWRERR